MKRIFTKVFSLMLVIAMVVSVFSFTLTAEATGANKNGSGVARALNNEGIVLMKNKNDALPLKSGANIAVFGEGQHLRLYTAEDFNSDNSMGAETLQIQHGYIPWGAGSSRALGVGGKDAAIDPLDAFNYLEALGKVNVYDAISQKYIDALESSNSDSSFVEYVPTEADYQGAVNAGVDTAVVIISRFDGECIDMPAEDWVLTASETSVLQNATKYFDKVIVVLNTPTPIDTSWSFDNTLGIDVDALLYAGYGGMQGGWAIADTIMGNVNPSGKLVTTYAKNLEDYPTTESFINDSSTQKYTEDIFLGYRYFETFNVDVNYEFGFGLSYTTFDITLGALNKNGTTVTATATVKNTGSVAGKEVVQLYVSAPQGALGKAAKVLAGFKKTSLLEPGASETLTITFDLKDIASFDDLGKTGNKSAYVLEAGDYDVLVGNSVKNVKSAGKVNVPELLVVEQLSSQCPTNLEERLLADGTFESLTSGVTPEAPTETVKTHDIGSALRIEAEEWLEKPYSTNASYTGSTENFTGVLYNKLTNTWDKLSGTTFSQAYMIKSITYKVNASTAGEYKISVRYASNRNNDNNANNPNIIPQISVATSLDNTTFGNETSFTCQKTSLIGGNAYHSYMDSNEVAVTLSEGVNYIKFNVSNAPNIDSFLIYYSEAGKPIVDGIIFEAEEYIDISSDNGYTKATTFTTGGWYYNGTTATEYAQSAVESMWPSGSYITLKVNAVETGRYKMVARCASTAASGLDVLTSTDGVTFTNPSTLGNIVVPEDTRAAMGKSGYNCYIDYAVDGYVYLQKGTNYIKLAKGTAAACNIDLFTLEKVLPTDTIESEEFDTIITEATTVVEYNKTGKLYNEETGTWDSYTASNLANGWQLTEATYQVYIDTPGEYTFNVIAASNNGRTGSVNLSSSVDNFTKKATAAVDDTKTPSGNSYFGYKKFTATGTFTLKEGVNTIKLTFGATAPNVDKFTLVRVSDVQVVTLDKVIDGTITLDDFVNQMTDSELATFFVSYPGLNFGGSDAVNAKYGFSRVSVADGPSGIGSKGTSFPSETVIACTWNTDLVEAFGRVVGAELYDNNIEVWLAPGMNLHRNPMSGRNSEYYSEDPFISGVMALTTTKAVQRYGVSVCLKHFVCNEKEENKLSQDVQVSERALREIYLKPFEMAIKEGGAQGLMSSYNHLNGIPVSENYDLLNNIVREEWGYEYYISGDWNNNNDMVKEINGGHGVREPYTYCDIDVVLSAIEAGNITRETLLKGAKYELNTLMMGKRNYSKWTNTVCASGHNYVDDICSVCHAPDPQVFAALDTTVDSLVDNMAKNVGLKATVLENTIGATSSTVLQSSYTNKLNTLNSDKTKAELSIYNTMASKADLRIKMGVYISDTKWTRVTGNDQNYSFFGDEDVYQEGGWLVIPYGSQATLYYDLSDSKYDAFDGSNGTYLRSQYTSIVYIGAPNCAAGDTFYMSGDNISSTASTQLGLSISTVNTDIALNGIGEYKVESVLLGNYGAVLDSALLTNAGLVQTSGNFFDGKVYATYVLKATDNADYIFEGWYDEKGELISAEKYVPYSTITVPTGENTIYARYTIKDAKAFTNTIQGATLAIGESLTINYYADLDEAHKDATLTVTRQGTSIELSGEKDSKTGMYIFAYEGINPQCMTDNVKAELKFDGQVISEKAEYSVKDYAMNQMAKTAEGIGITDAKYAALKTLLSDMLVYGDSAQDYMKYNQQDYATADVEWLAPSTFTAPTDAVKNVASGNTDENNRISSSGLNMSNVNKIYFVIKGTDATVYVDGKEVTPDESGKVYTDAIKATGFSTVHTAELKNGVDTIAKVEYNVNAYILAKSESATVGDIVKALNNYGVAAKTYASTK